MTRHVRFFHTSSLLLPMLMASALAIGCARSKPAQTGPRPLDPAAFQARSLELAREKARNGPARPVLDYEIGPLDVLDISVFEVPKYSLTARVGGDGTIRFPDLGIVKVGGTSERQIEDLLQKQLKEKELVVNPQVSVFVKELHAREVTVSGEVRSPGAYPIRGDETLIDVISKAGGVTMAAGNYVYILRMGILGGQASETASQQSAAPGAGALSPGQKPGPTDIKEMQNAGEASSLKIDLAGLMMRGESQWNIPIQAGDRITIPPVGWVHITGLGIEKAGTYQLRTAPSLLRQSIDDAGGLKFSANYNFLIIRRNPDGRDETFTLNYKNILKDEKNDIPLQGGDTVIVNRTMVKTALNAIGTAAVKVVRIGISIGGYIPLFGSGYGGGYGGYGGY